MVSIICGTAKAVPFRGLSFQAGCLASEASRTAKTVPFRGLSFQEGCLASEACLRG